MPDVRLSLTPELLAAVDAAKGDVPRVRWIRRAVERAVSEAKEQADPGSVSSGVRSAPPAEQPIATAEMPVVVGPGGHALAVPTTGRIHEDGEEQLSRADVFRKATQRR